jgi:pimeloyl-ACP methyl ester carboxylesterase
MRSLKTIAARLIQTLLVVVTVAAFTGCVWQSYASRRDAERFPPPGTLVNIGKHRLHIDCRGSGKPTLLLESGAQLWSSGWRHIHESLAGHYRVCAYDRSGLGWSDAGALPYDAEQAVLELKSLLDTARVDRPFVFVGHSYGGMLARVYHRRYPGEMAAAVYIDSGEPEMLIEDFAAKRNDKIRPCGFTCQMNIFAARLGIVLIVLNNLDTLDDPRLPGDAVAEFRALAPRPQSIKASLLIARHMPSAAFQTLDAGHIADLPVLVIYSGNYGELVSEGETPAEMARWRARYLGHWTDAVDASPDGVGPIEIAGANHLSVIAYREPAQLVSGEISRFIDDRFGPQE